MFLLATRVATTAFIDFRARALLAGCLIGWIIWEMSRVAGATERNLPAAIVVVIAGAASVALHTVHRENRTSRRINRRRLKAKARTCIGLVGCGVAVSINALQLLLG